MKGSDVQYLLNAAVKTSRSGFKSVLQSLTDNKMPAGIVTKIEEGFIEVTPFYQGKDGVGVQRINLDRVQQVIKEEPLRIKVEGGGKTTIECYMIHLA